MDYEDREAKRTILAAHKRRLAKLEEQRALQGYSRDPKIDLEIEDIERDIARIVEELKPRRISPSPPSTPPLAPTYRIRTDKPKSSFSFPLPLHVLLTLLAAAGLIFLLSTPGRSSLLRGPTVPSVRPTPSVPLPTPISVGGSTQKNEIEVILTNTRFNDDNTVTIFWKAVNKNTFAIKIDDNFYGTMSIQDNLRNTLQMTGSACYEANCAVGSIIESGGFIIYSQNIRLNPDNPGSYIIITTSNSSGDNVQWIVNIDR